MRWGCDTAAWHLVPALVCGRALAPGRAALVQSRAFSSGRRTADSTLVWCGSGCQPGSGIGVIPAPIDVSVGLPWWMGVASVQVGRLALCPNLFVTAAVNAMDFISSTSVAHVRYWPTRVRATAPVCGVEMHSWMIAGAVLVDI